MVFRDRYVFSAISTLVDVGGAQGELLAVILRNHPAMRGILFDTPSRLVGAEEMMWDAGVADRLTIVGGGFFL